MDEEWRKTGISFNISHIKENHKEIWVKYRDELIKGFPDIEARDVVYMNELIPYINGKVLLDFLGECMPKALLEEMVELKKPE